MIELPIWKKKGLIYSCNNSVFFKTHTTRPIPYLISENCLRIFFSSRDVNDIPYPSYIDVNPHNPSEILDINERPLLDIGRIGTFDDSGITPVSILNHHSGKLLLYYVGWKRRRYGISIETSIGVAEVDLKRNLLRRLFDGPILAQDINHPILTAAPFVIKNKNGYRMWYCSGSEWLQMEHGPEMLYTVYVADSNDGMFWKQTKSDPVIPPNFYGEVISAPWLVKTPDCLIMWYSRRGSASPRDKYYLPGVATSKDGLNWMRQDDNVGIARSSSGWDSEMICYPAVFNFHDTSYMFYSGNDVGKGGIGYAIAENKIDISKW